MQVALASLHTWTGQRTVTTYRSTVEQQRGFSTKLQVQAHHICHICHFIFNNRCHSCHLTFNHGTYVCSPVVFLQYRQSAQGRSNLRVLNIKRAPKFQNKKGTPIYHSVNAERAVLTVTGAFFWEIIETWTLFTTF